MSCYKIIEVEQINAQNKETIQKYTNVKKITKRAYGDHRIWTTFYDGEIQEQAAFRSNVGSQKIDWKLRK